MRSSRVLAPSSIDLFAKTGSLGDLFHFLFPRRDFSYMSKKDKRGFWGEFEISRGLIPVFFSSFFLFFGRLEDVILRVFYLSCTQG